MSGTIVGGEAVEVDRKYVSCTGVVDEDTGVAVEVEADEDDEDEDDDADEDGAAVGKLDVKEGSSG